MKIYKLYNDFNFVLGDVDSPNNYTSSTSISYRQYRTDLLLDFEKHIDIFEYPVVMQIGDDGVIHVELIVGDIIYIDTYSTQYKYAILSKIQRNDIIFEINEKSVVSIPFINVNPRTFEDITLKIQRNEKIDKILNI